MKRRLRASLSFSNLVALLALFVALGGTSYAVARNSIDTREIRNNDVRSWDIRNSTIRSRDIRNGVLRPEDFQAGALPADTEGLSGTTPQGQPSAFLTVGSFRVRVNCRQGTSDPSTADFVDVASTTNQTVLSYADSRAAGMDFEDNGGTVSHPFGSGFDRMLIQVAERSDRDKLATFVVTSRHHDGLCDFHMQGTDTTNGVQRRR